MRIVADGIIFQLQAGRSAGVSRVWNHLLPELGKILQGHELYFLRRSGTQQGFAGWRTIEIPAHEWNSVDALERDEARLAHLCGELKADVFLSTYFTHAPGLRNLLMVYDLIPEVLGWDLAALEWTAKRRAIEKASGYITISHSTWHDLTRIYRVAPERALVAYCGAGSEFCPPSLEAVRRFKTRHHLDRPYMLMVGSRSLYKNSEAVFKTLAEMPEAQRPGLLLVGGEGKALEGEARHLNQLDCRHCASLPDKELALAYGGAVALVYPSLYEGFGLPVLEAMSCGCPVITSHSSSLPEVGGEAVLYADPTSSESLASAIRLVFKPEVRAALAERGLVRSRLFSWQAMARVVAGDILGVRQPVSCAAAGGPAQSRQPSAAQQPATEAAGLDDIMRQADAAYAGGNLREALTFIQQAVAARPNDASLKTTLGSLHYQLGEWRQSFQVFGHLVQSQPNNPDLLVRFAAAAEACEDIETFEASLGRALQLAPEHADALKLLADLNLKTGRYADAAQVYGRLLKKTPNNIGVLLPLGRCLYEVRELDAAAAVFEQVLSLEPNHALARENLETVRKAQASHAPAQEASAPTVAADATRPRDPRLWLDKDLVIENCPDGAGGIQVNGVQGWLINGDLNYLFDKAMQLPPGAQVVEVGSFMGLSSIILVNGMLARQNEKAVLHCIDTWRGSEEHQDLDVIKQDQLYTRFLANIQNAGVDAWIKPLRKPSLEAVSQFADASLDMIYIDGDHSEEGCYADLEAWYPKLKPGGVFFGHDCTPNEGVRKALTRFVVQHGLTARIVEPPVAHYMFEITGPAVVAKNPPVAKDAATSSIPKVSEEPGVEIVRPEQPRDWQPRVTAIVSCYKADRFIQGCLEDLLAQTLGNDLEIVVVDSASPGNERPVVQEYQKNHPNLVYIRTAERETVYAAWNRAIKASRGRYITNANTDDRHRPDALEILARTLDQHPDVTVAYANCLMTRTENEVFATAHPTGKYIWLEFDPMALLQKGCFLGPQPMWRKEVHEEHGYFDAAMVSSGDYEFWLRICRNRKFLHVNQFLGLYLESPASIEHANASKAAQESLTARQRYAEDITRLHGGKAAITPPVFTEAILPEVGQLGRLKTAYELMGQGKYPEAWRAGLAAIGLRPYHPEAYVMMGECALAAGEHHLAQKCAERALSMAPDYVLAQNLHKQLPRKAKSKPSRWAALPVDTRKKPRLTVCLIARNEEEFIGKCLSSIKPIAHQIVVVDTGSTDRTMDIAREHGAEVHAFAWNDNFSDARNASLMHARGDWILVLDADEELPVSEHAKLLKDVSNDRAIGYRLPMVHRGMESRGIDHVPRLFRNAPGVFYVGRVHEQVFTTVVVQGKTWGLEVEVGAAQLVHYGYAPEVMKSRGKVERNLGLLETAATEMPDEPNIIMNLGLELVRSGRLDEGVERYREAFVLAGKHPALSDEIRESLLTQYCSCLVRKNRFEEIIEVLHSSVAQAKPLTASMHYLLGLSYMQLKKADEAIAEWRACLEKREQKTLTIILPEINSSAPWHCLAKCLLATGQYDEAERVLHQAVQMFPEAVAPGLDYAKLLHQRKKPVDALKFLHGMIQLQPQEASIWELGSAIALSDPTFIEFAVDWTAEAVKHCPSQQTIMIQRAEALLLAQNPTEALRYWGQPDALPAASQQAASFICALVAGQPLQGYARILSGQEAAIGHEFFQWYRRLVAFGAGQVVRDINGRLADLQKLLPAVAEVLKKLASDISDNTRS